MAYKSSPRPTFSEPTLIPYDKVTRYLWGDSEAGLVNDWIYLSSSKIHQLIFGFPAGEGFRHSESFRTIFGADEVLYVLQGGMVIANPETGEVQVVRKGEALFFRKDTWHNAWALPGEELRVLEYFAPPPSTGTSGKYAQTKPYVSAPKFERRELIGNWPMGREAAAKRGHFTVIREQDCLWSLSGGDPRVLIGLYASTEQLTAGKAVIAPGGKSDVLEHGGDTGLYVETGRLNVLLVDSELAQTWYELAPGDGFYLPEGARYRLFNMGTESCDVLFGVAPAYLPARPA
ncbi:MAG: cupin domain-containing protein [Proteobacteria bacterium]|nr:cupin domain-containing protein [Pseudomonadota bacterium]